MTTTISQLVTDYAPTIAESAGFDHTEYPATADGLADLLDDVTADLTPLDQTSDWLNSAAIDLRAVARLGDHSDSTQDVLKRIDAALYDAQSELAA